MRDWEAVKSRYMRDPVPRRLGGLAASLGRITSFSQMGASQEAVEGLIDESKRFIEWTAAETDIDTAAQLVELQVQLARWQHNWPEIWSSPASRNLVARESADWSERILDLSGLLTA